MCAHMRSSPLLQGTLHVIVCPFAVTFYTTQIYEIEMREISPFFRSVATQTQRRRDVNCVWGGGQCGTAWRVGAGRLGAGHQITPICYIKETPNHHNLLC